MTVLSKLNIVVITLLIATGIIAYKTTNTVEELEKQVSELSSRECVDTMPLDSANVYEPN
jgi:hypothetical protein